MNSVMVEIEKEEENMKIPEEETVRLFKDFEESEKWFSEHYDELRENYADMMLAIKDKKVISTSSEMEELFKDLNSKNVDVNSVYIASIPPEGIAFIL